LGSVEVIRTGYSYFQSVQSEYSITAILGWYTNLSSQKRYSPDVLRAFENPTAEDLGRGQKKNKAGIRLKTQSTVVGAL